MRESLVQTRDEHEKHRSFKRYESSKGDLYDHEGHCDVRRKDRGHERRNKNHVDQRIEQFDVEHRSRRRVGSRTACSTSAVTTLTTLDETKHCFEDDGRFSRQAATSA